MRDRLFTVENLESLDRGIDLRVGCRRVKFTRDLISIDRRQIAIRQERLGHDRRRNDDSFPFLIRRRENARDIVTTVALYEDGRSENSLRLGICHDRVRGVGALPVGRLEESSEIDVEDVARGLGDVGSAAKRGEATIARVEGSILRQERGRFNRFRNLRRNVSDPRLLIAEDALRSRLLDLALRRIPHFEGHARIERGLVDPFEGQSGDGYKRFAILRIVVNDDPGGFTLDAPFWILDKDASARAFKSLFANKIRNLLGARVER